MNLNERLDQFQRYLCYRIEKLILKEKGGDSLDGFVLARFQINNDNTADITVTITNDNTAKMSFVKIISLTDFEDTRYIPSIITEKVSFTIDDIRKSNKGNYFVFLKSNTDYKDVHIFAKNNKMDIVDICPLFMNDSIYVISSKEEPTEGDFFAYKIIIE